MYMEAVVSSNIKSIGYDEGAKILEIEFFSGGIYQYFHVPGDVYYGLMNAESHGKYFASEIKKYPRTYPYARVY